MELAFSQASVFCSGARNATSVSLSPVRAHGTRRSVLTPPLRRRRRALTSETQPPADETTENSGEPGKPKESTASDLVLPDLRELFTGAGAKGCEQCSGKGEAACPVCDSQGFVTITMMDTVSSSQCRLCKGKRRIPCPSCRQEVYKSVLWWDLIPSKEDDPDENWRSGPDGEPRIQWSDNPAGPDNS